MAKIVVFMHGNSKRNGYKEPSTYYICLNECHPNQWSILNTPGDLCLCKEFQNFQQEIPTFLSFRGEDKTAFHQLCILNTLFAGMEVAGTQRYFLVMYDNAGKSSSF